MDAGTSINRLLKNFRTHIFRQSSFVNLDACTRVQIHGHQSGKSNVNIVNLFLDVVVLDVFLVCGVRIIMCVGFDFVCIVCKVVFFMERVCLVVVGGLFVQGVTAQTNLINSYHSS